MKESEKIAYAKLFLDKLANGVNPLDDTPIPEGDLAKHVRLSRCFHYVSGILDEVIEKTKRSEEMSSRPKRSRFFVTPEQLKDFQYSEEPITGGELCRRLDALVDPSCVKHISRARLPAWLVHVGLLYPSAEGGRHYARVPTEEGLRLGISEMTYTNDYGTYTVPAFGIEAQRFVIDNMDALLAFKIESRRGQRPEEDPEESPEE